MRLLNDFDKWLLKDRDWETTSHHASQIGGCNRQRYYGWIKTEKSNPDTAGGILKMKFGFSAEDIFGEFLAEFCEEKGYFLESQVKAKISYPGLEFPISGSSDWIIHGDKKYGIELKSMFGRGIVQIQKTGKPKSDYLKQIFIYANLHDIDDWIHPYIGRDFGYRTEFEIKRVKQGLNINGQIYKFQFKDVIEKCKKLETHLKAKTTPKRDKVTVIKNHEFKDKIQHKTIEYKGDWECNYCSWRNTCWADIQEKPGIWLGEAQIG